MRSDPGLTASFSTPGLYQDAYFNIKRGFLACMTGANAMTPDTTMRIPFPIRPRIDVAAQTATITYLEDGGVVKNIWAIVDIKAAPAGTDIKVFTTSLMTDLGPAVQKWAGGSDDCPKHVPVGYRYPLTE